MSAATLVGWDRLRHGGLLLDPPRLNEVAAHTPDLLPRFVERDLRKRVGALQSASGVTTADVSDFIAFVLRSVCGFDESRGSWQRGSKVPAEWGRTALSGETVKPRHLWQNPRGGVLPVFIDREKRVGVGRGRRTTSQVLGWLREGDEQLALISNGRQWRLVFAGLDYDAWCEWDIDLWLEEGSLSPQVTALRALLQPALWTPPKKDASAPLLVAIRDSRKGQADLSAVLGERVRAAVETLVQAHGEVLRLDCADVPPAEIYRAAVRVVMRLVVVLFAESRDLLPRDNSLYHGAYGLGGLFDELEKVASRGGSRLSRANAAWPRLLALFALIRDGSHHPALPVPAYGGDLFAPGDAESPDGLSRALAVFENACFERELLNDREVHTILEEITSTRVKLRQGRTAIWVAAPIDFSDLSSEYIGILYEGLLDFELRTAPVGDPVIFLAVGDQPALPLSRLEAMGDKELRDLFENLKDKKKDGEPKEEESEETEADTEDEESDTEIEATEGLELTGDDSGDDERHTTRSRAETWARRAVEVAKLVKKPRGKLTPEKRLLHEEQIARKARQLVTRVILPSEWYLVRWGGTRKGSGTFYTRPGLAVPTVQRTLRPLCYGEEGVRSPEEILALKVCDPACGSGTFPVAALRYLTNALYASLHCHGRIFDQQGRALVSLLEGPGEVQEEGACIQSEMLPCAPDHETFEPRLKAVLRRHVVERCIYGVDLDPLAVELCRLALWVETMDRTLPFSFLDHKVKCGNALVGAWFDQFRHYPVMAFKNREGGDKSHSGGVHFEKNARGKALKAFVKEMTPLLVDMIKGQSRLGEGAPLDACAVHDEALSLLDRLHALPVQDSAERSRVYREQLLGAASWCTLKEAMDLWCACWFWPADRLDCAPLPGDFTSPPEETRRLSAELAASKRFFHWELEFPDVFREEGAGFDAALGNPPWEVAKPNSKEFFSNIDPLYRSYGKQEALRKQSESFASEIVEHYWLNYNADFRAQSNLFKYAATPFGDPDRAEKSADRFSLARGKANAELHVIWRSLRAGEIGFADLRHPFTYQGSADINLYKLFLEQAHALLRQGGRLGFIVPSGLYSDQGTGALRELFLEHSSWEWIFGFENREKIFDIHRSFKFNPVIIEKSGRTHAISTAFMRRSLEDWERAEEFATDYTVEQVEQFSPHSRAILEIQSARDLEILEKIYANSVLLGDDGPDGWGIKYATEFHMTNDSKLFPPRPKWEEQGYRPDEYSRWLKGDWRPIDELWAELGTQPLPAGETRCAQPPYEILPIPRADIPAGIFLSRNVDAFIREDVVQDVALPLYQGIMFYGRKPNVAQHLRGSGRRAEWNKEIEADAAIQPQFLISRSEYAASEVISVRGTKIAIRSLSNATNERTVIAAAIPDLPAGHSVNYLSPEKVEMRRGAFLIMSSLVFDWQARGRIAGTNMTFHFLEEMGLPSEPAPIAASRIGLGLTLVSQAATRLEWGVQRLPLRPAEQLRQQAMIDALIAEIYGLDLSDLKYILRDCDLAEPNGAANGFWRVDKERDPELRHTVLTVVAFTDLQEKIRAGGGDRDSGIEAFLEQNDGEGWLLPETLCLADYGLGHDDRAKEPQPVASRLGPRFYDWQLAQTPEESWRECHLHARNLLGEDGYRQLLADIEAEGEGQATPRAVRRAPSADKQDPQGTLFN